ncbi:MAG TPA: hypothetical protein VF550_10960, partial [Polyangia bacterium]
MRHDWTVFSRASVLLACFALANCGGDSNGTNAGSATSGIVVVNSDYSSTSVSILDRDGNLLKDGCLSTGTGTPGLALALSGDVVLPTQVPLGGPVAIID